MLRSWHSSAGICWVSRSRRAFSPKGRLGIKNPDGRQCRAASAAAADYSVRAQARRQPRFIRSALSLKADIEADVPTRPLRAIFGLMCRRTCLAAAAARLCWRLPSVRSFRSAIRNPGRETQQSNRRRSGSHSGAYSVHRRRRSRCRTWCPACAQSRRSTPG